MCSRRCLARPHRKPPDGTSVLVPRNGTVLQVIFFAGLVGFAFVRLGEKNRHLRRLAGEASETMIQITRFVLEFTPLGTFGLIAALVGGYGFEQLRPLLTFVIACTRPAPSTSSWSTAACCSRTDLIR
jgi:Na+/H+-dicarboxylate symporter